MRRRLRGEDCGVRQCPQDCNQPGVCQDGVLPCWEGFAGEDSRPPSPPTVTGRGRCSGALRVRLLATQAPPATAPARPTAGAVVAVCRACACATWASAAGTVGRKSLPASACPGAAGPRELCSMSQCVCVEASGAPLRHPDVPWGLPRPGRVS